jgi:hypothetical protein
MTNEWKALCTELAKELAEEYGVQREFDGGDPLLGSGAIELLSRARTALAQPEPEGPTDEEIMRLMPQQMHEDLAAAARALAEHAGTISTSATGIMRIMLNRHAVDLARAVLARWGRSPQ